MRGLLVKAIIHLTSLLPLALAHKLGSLLGRALVVLPNKHKHIAAINIGLCFPDWTTQQRQTLLHDNLIELGKSIFEIGALWRWKKEKVLGLIQAVHGEDLFIRTP